MIIAPSILSLDYSQMNEQMNLVNESKAQWIHFDVMDGHFVPNLTFGPDILKGFKKITPLLLDVHLMVENPRFFADVFIDAGADLITFHVEAMKDKQDLESLIKHIQSRNVKVGLTIKPKTPVSVLDDYISTVDLFLIMSVEPGFGGQSFIESSLDKIRYLRQKIDAASSNALIQVDGGINETTAKWCKEAGATVLVAGSYIFKQNIQQAIESLCQ
ncbi:MAG TPA: ribulose-phosphate 3-epimerase [Erysipelotrichaceae bacterium]|nr:ribulose-phosphate 3-epimerase [Erysipelotrichaceae bacterium]